MGDKLIFPHPEVLDALFKKFASNKEEVAAINGDLGTRLQTQYENHEHFTPFAWGIIKKLCYTALSNEQKALLMCDIAEESVKIARARIQKNGHVGDMVSMAEKKAKEEPTAKSDALSPEEAKKAFEATADKAPTPAEVDAKASKRAAGRKKAAEAKPEGDSVDQFRASLKETVKQGDDHIRKIADKHVADQNKRLGAANDSRPLDDDDELAPPTPPADFPEIPADLDRRSSRKKASPLEGATGQGSYKVLQ